MTGVTPHDEGVASVATPTDDDRSLVTVIAHMTAQPGTEQELPEVDELLVGGSDGPVVTQLQRIQ